MHSKQSIGADAGIIEGMVCIHTRHNTVDQTAITISKRSYLQLAVSFTAPMYRVRI